MFFELRVPTASPTDSVDQKVGASARWVPAAFAAALLGLGTVTAQAAPITLAASGPDSGSIQVQVDNFRALLGNPNNGNAPGPLGGGRREINWDGGGSLVTAPGPTPFTVFQNIRGSTSTTPGTGFLQTPVDTSDFLAINPTYGTTFEAFSPVRVFTSIGSNIVDTTFSIPGTNGAVSAAVSGFGAVFSDVDLANTTSLQFFDPSDVSLGTFYVPALGNQNQTLSFLGVYFNAGEQISRVRIVNGNSALGPNDGGGVDVVVMDDFLYSEPFLTAVPEPATFTLLGIGLLGLGLLRRRRAAA